MYFYVEPERVALPLYCYIQPILNSQSRHNIRIRLPKLFHICQRLENRAAEANNNTVDEVLLLRMRGRLIESILTVGVREADT